MRQLLFYASRDDEDKKRLETAIHDALPGWPIEFFTQLDALRDRFRNIVEPDSIAIFLAADYEELHKMQILREFLTEIYVLLVIPDWKESTIKLAHLLMPRFISQKTDDFSDLKKVLIKMTQSSE